MVADDARGVELDSILTQLHAMRIEIHAVEELKTAPRGYPKDHPRVDLRKKDLAARRQWDPVPWLASSAATTRIVASYRATKPLNGWLDANVGPSSARRTP